MHTCVSIPTCICVVLTHIHTHITWRIELVTRARFDFIPSLPSRLSLGSSHKQSPSSKSRYEISLRGVGNCHMFASWPASPLQPVSLCLCAFVCVCVCVCVRGKRGRIITHRRIYRSVPPPRCTGAAAHKVASCMSHRQPLTYSSSHLSCMHTHLCMQYLWIHTHKHITTNH